MTIIGSPIYGTNTALLAESTIITTERKWTNVSLIPSKRKANKIAPFHLKDLPIIVSELETITFATLPEVLALICNTIVFDKSSCRDTRFNKGKGGRIIKQ